MGLTSLCACSAPEHTQGDSDAGKQSSKESAQGSSTKTDSGEATSPDDGQETGEKKGEEQDPNQDSDAGEHDEPSSAPKFDLGAMPDPEEEKKELRPCEIDFLFVVDNSISMDSKQVNLINSVPSFIKTMMTSTDLQKDFHIGVVTTDVFAQSTDNCKKLGGLVTQVKLPVKQPNGKMKRVLVKCGPYKSGLNYMTHEDDLNRTLTCAARPGQVGDARERQVGAMLGAIDPENAKKGSCNEGFIRDEALLVTVFITDEDAPDHEGTPADWHKRVLKVKGNDPKKVVTVSIVVPEPNQCDPEDTFVEHGAKLIEYTKLFEKRGFVGDVCAPNYDPLFKEAMGVIDFACGELVNPPQ